MVAAVVAGMTIADLFVGNTDLFHPIAGFLRALGKLIAQDIRIAAHARAAR